MTPPVGINAGHFFRGVPAGFADTVRRIEDLGFDGLWFAEAYGSDVFTPLAYAAALTSRIRLGTAVAQIPARTPAATATTATTLDHLSGGRVVLGLGASGPQVSEGWHGVAYPRPLARTREYVDVVRQVLAREQPLDHDGEFHQLPLRGGTGLGKPLRSSLHVLRPDLPIQLGAEGPRNIALAAEIADGWHAMFFSPAFDDFYRTALEEGFARRGGRPEHFEVVCTLPVVVDTDIERAADRIRPDLALYMGGMGARGANFHHDVFVRMGHAETAARVQDLYLRGEKAAAAAAVPTSLVEEIALIGPVGKIREDLARWSGTVVDSLAVQGLPEDLEIVAKALL
ncbi:MULTISPECIES: LLM class F420-dependent oxidoreductase [Pseudonocardia]|uniref:Phthiodiolone/phenolphthiodiolone dimycocerosates ketoreductase n=2 Tax=Pseudonocardia TaxID=1847 RepID=A0A1Y2N6J4_PSEAH|nr:MULTISPECIES: LLM class F420-dependent oxidoreductase [Pseudonocardia]OSY42717.1 Phthiodiolone/phenolphthiodiolone dimycocerosates ketoreductase [Pseudonocardia autotrophica]TDN77294.1 F420-dependent oxidoreductase-like protein [Pseudonocardia autotrophica]BBG01315.1 LLM class F420-dependent oxidoreductase [Pseudonocardia autotrophica]GEC29688.1 LLM class F420-dependent oxidoreductase [Pseudonocardia saturnea]